MNEEDLIAYVARAFDGGKGRGVEVGIGDDAAVIALGDSRAVVTVDALFEGVHFDLRWIAPDEVGARAVEVNLSDIAAMGAEPHSLLLAIGARSPLDEGLVRSVIDGFAGRVEHIGLRSTRLRSVNGEQIVLSNADLLKGRIRNYHPLTDRRVKLTLGVTYGTPAEKLAAIPGFARAVIEAVPLSRFDRAHIVRLAESSIDVEVVFTFQSADALAHLDAQQAVILGLLRKLEAEGIQLAFPTRTVHLSSPGAPHA